MNSLCGHNQSQKFLLSKVPAEKSHSDCNFGSRDFPSLLPQSENGNSLRAPVNPPQMLRWGWLWRLPRRTVIDMISFQPVLFQERSVFTPPENQALLSKSGVNYRRKSAKLHSLEGKSQLQGSGTVKWLLYFKNYFIHFFPLRHWNKQALC